MCLSSFPGRVDEHLGGLIFLSNSLIPFLYTERKQM